MKDVAMRGRTPVVVITYGHDSEMVSGALEAALEISKEDSAVAPVVLDDHSGRAPVVAGAECLVTPENLGYAAAVNFAVERFAGSAARIVFVNPDAVVSSETLRALIVADPTATIVAPAIRQGPHLENLRGTLSCANVLLMLVAMRLGRQKLHPSVRHEIRGRMGDGWTVAGTVASFDAEFLQEHPLRDEMFWVEMSAWANDYPQATFRILATSAMHVGGSSKATAATAVVCSRLSAQVAYVRRYGSRYQRAALPLAFALGRIVQLATGKITVNGFRNLWRMYVGRLTWQQIREL